MDKQIEYEYLKFYADWAYNNPNAPALTKNQLLQQIAKLQPLEFAQDIEPISENEELRILLEFAQWEKSQLQDEITDLKLSKPSSPAVDMKVYLSLFEELQRLKASLEPVTEFFEKPVPKTSKKLTAKQKKQQELEEYERMMDAKALSSIKKGT